MLALISVLALPHFARAQDADVPYVPTPMNVVDAMLQIAKVGPQDFVIDLGSGDGRIVIVAARKYGARGLGVELDGALVSDARREAARQGVAGKVEFRAENLFITELERATVLTTYLYPRLNLQLRPRIFEQLKPGTRVVSHEFDFGNWKPDARVTVPVPEKRYGPPRSDVLMWIVPANAAGTWQWRAQIEGRELACEVTFQQVFQEIRGSARAAGAPARIENARLRGTELAFVLVTSLDGREVRQELAGRVAGDTIRGSAKLGGTQTQWQAARVKAGRIEIEAAAREARVAFN
ncbi:MAG TPA: SAM-dependent methyltransferase [Burkholderiales bacterium]|nr:SAM-dependent methyltransferase [Burkholderiales bacterium]